MLAGKHESRMETAKLASWMKQSKYTVVLTGAGMSTESGIPDFRSENGWWRRIDPRSVATKEVLYADYTLFHEFYSMRIRGLTCCKPHKGYYILAQWEKNNIINSIATQNVDRFHQIAGNHKVYELHGCIRTIRCDSCGTAHAMGDFLDGSGCTGCGGRLRPDVVLFGEALPRDTWEKAMTDIERAELVIVIGTSLQVYPVNQLPFMTRGRIAYINNEIGGDSHQFDLFIKGKAGDILCKLDEIITS